MSIDVLSRPLHVLSTRVYESGPSKIMMKPEQISTSKQEEWLTSRKKEELVTKQIETRVQREIFIDENGEIVKTGEPDVKTNTTEDIKTDETETTEHKTTVSEPPLGPDWKLVPGSTVCKEKIQKRNTNIVTHEEKTEAEELQELNGFPREELISEIKSQQYHAIKDDDRPSRIRPLTESKTLLETEELHEVSESLGDTVLNTDKRHTIRRELSPSVKTSVFDERNIPLTTHSKNHRNRYERPQSSPPSPPVSLNHKRNVFHSSLKINDTQNSQSSYLSPLASVTANTSLSSPPVSSLITKKLENNDILSPKEKCKEKETSRWIQSHFGYSPETTQISDIGSTVQINNSIKRTNDMPTSPNNFSAIKDYFQNAVEQTETYFSNKRSNTINRREKTHKTSSSSSGSNTPPFPTNNNKSCNASVSVENETVYECGNGNTERVSRPVRRTESLNNSVSPRQNSHKSVRNEYTNKNLVHHDDFTAYSTLQRNKVAFTSPSVEDQELNVQRIINSFRSPQLKDFFLTTQTSNRTISPSPSGKTKSRISSDGKHVIKISIPTTSSNPSLYSPNDDGNSNEFTWKKNSSSDGNSPSQRLRMRVSTGSTLNKYSSVNRSTPNLIQSSIKSSSENIPSGRSASSLDLNQVCDDGSISKNNTSISHKNQSKSGSSSIWISNSESEIKRHQFMQKLLQPKDESNVNNEYDSSYSSSFIENSHKTPTPPPRRHHKNKSQSQKMHSNNTKTKPSSHSVFNPESNSISKSFYFLGEEEQPSKSDSPNIRVEKTTKRCIRTPNVEVKESDPCQNQTWKQPSAEVRNRNRNNY